MAEKKSKNVLVKLSNVRLSYPYLFSPKQPDPSDSPGKKAKYEATFILDKKLNTVEIAAMKAGIAEVMKDPKIAGKKIKHQLLRPGDDTDARADADGYGVNVFSVGSRTERRPGVVNRKKEPLTEEDGVVYAGCYVNATIDLYAYNHPKNGPGVGASLRNVQFVRDGGPLGERAAPAEKDFDELPDESVDEAPAGV